MTTVIILEGAGSEARPELYGSLEVVVYSEPVDDFGATRTMLDERVGPGLHLHADTDEIFDPDFLERIDEIGKLAPAFSFPRVNIGHVDDYPDRQVRLFNWTPAMEWRGKVHEVLWNVDEGRRQDQVNVMELDYNIIHMPRKKSRGRPWW